MAIMSRFCDISKGYLDVTRQNFMRGKLKGVRLHRKWDILSTQLSTKKSISSEPRGVRGDSRFHTRVDRWPRKM